MQYEAPLTAPFIRLADSVEKEDETQPLFLHSASAAVTIKYVLKGIEASNPQLSLLLCAYQNRQTKLSIQNKLEMIGTISMALRGTHFSGNTGRALSSLALQEVSTHGSFPVPLPTTSLGLMKDVASPCMVCLGLAE